MKSLIALILLAPAFASAACLPMQVCVATRGTAVVNDLEVPFNFAGKGFSASGELTDFGNPESPFTLTFLELGATYDASIGGLIPGGPLVQFDLTVNGVPWGIPAGGEASVSFLTVLHVSGAFPTISSPFTFSGSFTGAPEPFAPGLGFDVLNCETLNFSGGGIVTFDMGLSLEHPGAFTLEQETFKFGVVPEPATASLLLIAFVGLAVMDRRRGSREVSA